MAQAANELTDECKAARTGPLIAARVGVGRDIYFHVLQGYVDVNWTSKARSTWYLAFASLLGAMCVSSTSFSKIIIGEDVVIV